LLEYANRAWMTVEAAIAITAGVIAASIALAGFALDSVIELFLRPRRRLAAARRRKRETAPSGSAA